MKRNGRRCDMQVAAGLLILIQLWSGLSAKAQTLREDAVKILDVAFQDKNKPDVPFLPYLRTHLSTYLYKPLDIEKVDHSGIHLNKFIRTSQGLFILIEGTGRIYKVVQDSSAGYAFIRQDSTTHIGYNNGATAFAFRDTIFSLGGYGYWRFNGQLRYFNPQLAGWEIVPTNRAVQVREPEVGFFFDEPHASVWYVNRKNRHEGFLSSAQKELPMEENTVFRLNLNTREWVVMGPTSSAYRSVADERDVVGMSKWGPVVLTGNSQNPGIAVFNYESNRIWKLPNPEMCLSIHLALLRNGVEQHRIATFFRNDSLLVLSNGAQSNAYHLPKQVFQETPDRIYEELAGNSVLEYISRFTWMFWLLLGLTTGAALCYFYLIRSTAKNLTEPDREIFTTWEKRVLLAFQHKAGSTLSVEEMDEILQTADRSKDVQNQKRSSVTRAINNKYNLLTGDPENLIETRRQEFDRRMISYYLSEEKFAAIKDKVEKGEET